MNIAYTTSLKGQTMIRWTMAAAAVLASGWVQAAEISLEKVEVVSGDKEFATPAQVLVEEIEHRTGIKYPLDTGKAAAGRIEFRKSTEKDAVGSEGFAIATTEGSAPQVTIAAAGRRGALFGVGYLLRQLDCSKGKVG